MEASNHIGYLFSYFYWLILKLNITTIFKKKKKSSTGCYHCFESIMLRSSAMRIKLIYSPWHCLWCYISYSFETSENSMLFSSIGERECSLVWSSIPFGKPLFYCFDSSIFKLNAIKQMWSLHYHRSVNFRKYSR